MNFRKSSLAFAAALSLATATVGAQAEPVKNIVLVHGAWVDGDEETYWGVGPGNKEKCDDCCYTCNGGETEEIELTP